MEITEDKIIKNMLNNANTTREILFYHTSLNGLAFHVAFT